MKNLIYATQIDLSEDGSRRSSLLEVVKVHLVSVDVPIKCLAYIPN